MVEVSLTGIGFSSGTREPYLFFQEVESGYELSAPLHLHEAELLIREIKGEHLNAPSIYETFATFLSSENYKITHTIFSEVIGDSIIAKVHLKKGIKEKSIKVSAGQGVLLSLYLGTPVFVEENVVKVIKALSSEQLNISASFPKISQSAPYCSFF